MFIIMFNLYNLYTDLVRVGQCKPNGATIVFLLLVHYKKNFAKFIMQSFHVKEISLTFVLFDIFQPVEILFHSRLPWYQKTPFQEKCFMI